MAGIFVSYRRSDTGGYARGLRGELRERYGRKRVFWDLDAIAAGSDLPDRIGEGLRGCPVFLALIGPEWLDISGDDGRRRLDDPEDYVRREVAGALDPASRITVLPVLVDGARMPRAEELPEELAPLADLAALELANRTWDFDVAAITAAIDQRLLGRSRAPWLMRVRMAHGDALARPLLAAIAAVACVVGIALYATHAWPWLEEGTVDLRFGLRADRPPAKDIAIVGIDPKTIAERGPVRDYPRTVHAKVLGEIARQHPRVIGYDIAFTSPRGVEEDNALVDALAGAARTTRVVLAAKLVREGQTKIMGASGKQVEAVTKAAGRDGVQPAAAMLRVGSGQAIRRIPYDVHGVPSFARSVAEGALGHWVEPDRLRGDAWIDYAGPPGTYRVIPFVDVLRHRPLGTSLRGKIVLVGWTDPSLGDVHATSLAGTSTMTGVEIEANAIDTVRRGAPLRPLPDGAAYLLLVLLACLPPALALLLRRRFVPILAGALAGVVYLVVAQWRFGQGDILPVVPVMAALGVAIIGVLAVGPVLRRRAERRAPDFPSSSPAGPPAPADDSVPVSRSGV